jgi:hypothetical protein
MATFVDLVELRKHYSARRKRNKKVALFDGGDGFVAVWNSDTKHYDWYLYNYKCNAYVNTGSVISIGHYKTIKPEVTFVPGWVGNINQWK